MAEGVGRDVAAYEACMASDRPEQAVATMKAEAPALGVNSTPSTFVNGQKIEWQGRDTLKAAIDAALAAGPAPGAATPTAPVGSPSPSSRT